MKSQSSCILPINNVRYQIIEELGFGVTAKVYKALTLIEDDTNAKINTFQAIKNVSHGFSYQFDREINCLDNLHHDHIIKMKDYKFPSIGFSHQIIVLEYCENELFDLIQQKLGFPEHVGNYYFNQIVSALSHIHSQGYCHRDLKPGNIFLDSQYQVKVADFSFGCLLKGKNGDNKLETICGTEAYMAPEIILGKTYNGRCTDVFSLGTLLFVMIMCNHPFDFAKTTDFYYRLLIKQPESFWPLFQIQPSKQFKDLIQNMLKFDPNERYTLEQVKAHPWFNQMIPSQDEIKQFFEQIE